MKAARWVVAYVQTILGMAIALGLVDLATGHWH